MSTELIRCPWCLKFPQYVQYHDEEWGVPVYDDQKHFEFLILEGAQSGLSWETILKKRAGYKKVFKNFDVRKVSRISADEIQQILQDPSIVRNKLKVHSAVTNAVNFIKIQEEYGSFSNYIWSFVDHKPVIHHWKSLKEILPTNEISDKLSKDLTRRGFKFVGSTVMYAHMQACGLVNDHLIDCFRYKQLL